MHGVLADVVTAAGTGVDRTIVTVLNDAGRGPGAVHESQQRTEQRVGQEHRGRSGKDREREDWTA